MQWAKRNKTRFNNEKTSDPVKKFLLLTIAGSYIIIQTTIVWTERIQTYENIHYDGP